jgi:hypothetical protein
MLAQIQADPALAAVRAAMMGATTDADRQAASQEAVRLLLGHSPRPDDALAILANHTATIYQQLDQLQNDQQLDPAQRQQRFLELQQQIETNKQLSQTIQDLMNAEQQTNESIINNLAR